MVTVMLGKKLGGRYQIIQNLGEGAFGVTFVAEDMQRPGNPQCVVKQFQPKNTDPHTLREAPGWFHTIREKLKTVIKASPPVGERFGEGSKSMIQNEK